ncbi:MAG: amidohydrolase family protein, partial [Anaerolineaceae bacterium]|nr:amidohydrolase family protein [Anaerolineaceae bacterium]
PEHYPWQPIGGYVPENEAPAEKLLALMDAAGVDGAVLVQPTPYGWDNSYLLDAAGRYPDRFRCVCLVDPLAEDGPDDLRRLVGEHRIAGIRINWNIHPAEVWLTNAHHHSLWKTASKLEMPICLQLTPDYLHLLGGMAEEYGVRVVVDHLGRPVKAASPSNAQFKALLGLAVQKNIFVKLSGLNYYSGEAAPYRDVCPLIEAVCEQFGAQRCMWGSDYPFVQDHWSYSGLLSTVKDDWNLSSEHLGWVLGGTASRLWWRQ